MESRRLPSGSSDPVSFVCSCSARSDGGLVLLFYRYFAALPVLPTYQTPEHNPAALAAFHARLTEKFRLGGKIRVATEGFNITVGGTREDIKAYMQECLSHWSSEGLDLDTERKQNEFFKPTAGGCACAFGGPPASVRVAAEITPMGVTNYSPKNWDSIEVLSPAEFHARCYSEPNALLLDVRNYYESRIGYFINPKTGQPALRPPIRRFSQWPQYVTKYMTRSNDDGAPGEEPREARQILTFCTGGIRCEKGARYMQENMSRQPADKVATLQGGIAAYLSWINEEVKQGRKKPSDSLFKGRNFVFDARGSTALDEPLEPVSKCHECERASDRLSKCRSQGCHLVLVICPLCEVSKDPRCCQSCLDMHPQNAENESPPEKVPSAICKCEKERERQLWGEGSRKLPRALKKKRDESSTTGKVDIRAKLIC